MPGPRQTNPRQVSQLRAGGPELVGRCVCAEIESGPSHKPGEHDRHGDNKEKGNGSDNAVALYEGMIFRNTSKAVAHSYFVPLVCALSGHSLPSDQATDVGDNWRVHTVIAHCIKVKPNKIGEGNHCGANPKSHHRRSLCSRNRCWNRQERDRFGAPW